MVECVPPPVVLFNPLWCFDPLAFVVISEALGPSDHVVARLSHLAFIETGCSITPVTGYYIA